MARSKKRVNPEEVHAAALAAYLLSVSTLRFFVKKGIVAQDEAGLILTGVLLGLENSDLVSEPAAHGARSLLSTSALSLGFSKNSQTKRDRQMQKTTRHSLGQPFGVIIHEKAPPAARQTQAVS